MQSITIFALANQNFSSDQKTGKAIPTTFVTYPKDRNGKDDVALYDDVSRFVARPNLPLRNRNPLSGY